ncbi:HAMP domain-containing histidine kinase, partial [bacterium]|nr:HAMP domain-containing histidine kinase [bacterium]
QLSLHNIAVNLDLADSIPLIKCHSTQIEQMILNLLNNATQALDISPRKRKVISIATKYLDNNCVIDVIDNGHGIKGEHIKHIFEPFFTSEKGEKSIGLGLSIVYNIVERHNGVISVKNKKGGGAHFTIKLPLT